ncbi:MAG: hypothetical protein IJN15_03280 [Clostridia bacterium]|nr:hypothetical protein [Clostridia bacterium]
MKYREIKPHPLAIWDFIKPLLFVWLLPLVKRVAERIFFGDTQKSFFLEAATIAAIVVYGALKFKNYKLSVSAEKIILISGKTFKKRKFIYKEGIFAIKSQKTFLNLIFGGFTLFLQLEGQSRAIKLRLSKLDARLIQKILFDE